MSHKQERISGLSAVELLIVVVILGLVAALAIPRFSRAAEHDPAERQARTDLVILRTAIELYHQQHGAYPGQVGDGTPDGPPGSEAALLAQLSLYTDATGRISRVKSDEFRFGPYLREGMPASLVAPSRGRRGVHVVKGETPPRFVASAPDAGWVYNADTGYIAINSDRLDADGLRFDQY